MPQITIAIDGFSSCGKSTLARDLAARMQYGYIDSGAMYRAVTLYCLQQDIDINQSGAVAHALAHIKITFECISGLNYTFLNGTNVEHEIRRMEVSNQVSFVAAIPSVRKAMVEQQRNLGKEKGIIMDGRDIGTVVFPRAELKIFLTAELSKRIDRRYLELKEKGQSVTRSEVQHNLEQRDRIDSTRKESPLRRAGDAVVIDNTNLDRLEQLEMAAALALTRIRKL